MITSRPLNLLGTLLAGLYLKIILQEYKFLEHNWNDSE